MSSFNVDASVSKYYIHSSYIPTYYYVYIFIEQWLAANIFRNDLSRVFMASNDYAFRRRFELTDMSENYEDIDASSLRFPFGNYWAQNTGWKVDDRPAANTAAQVYEGLYLGTTKVRAVNVTLPVGIQLYFDREDDARLAYDRLFFYSFNRHFYSTEANIAGNTSPLSACSCRTPGSDIPLQSSPCLLQYSPRDVYLRNVQQLPEPVRL